MEFKRIELYDAAVILPLYQSVGWTAYTDSPDSLRRGFENSLLTLGAYDGENLLGLIRAVGDGHTVVLVQDLLVHPGHQRQGIGTKLLRAVMERYADVRQLLLATDNTAKTRAFYKLMGLREFSEIGCCAFMRL